ncbi:uncharacterized protein Z518_00571 [Rhinocladiella mackenziei CBS 650.93]|uniref:Uncharacterized protein n=1 Tax=Rhinocladiella mackenziei CBS 650.93 TaxID=1442369 RepID=A0A0D2J1D8_9EURO|nr:uncharacterized protein Z518_00571 [Rhinocladiella mackenziei CBS 650.93]KIX09491.1 hypothetical protein Z518_00571 [Rhinocladiella mackenziei CBS 650.93]
MSTWSSSQASQAKSVTTEEEPKDISMVELLRWLEKTFPKEFEEKIKYMMTSDELHQWLEKNHPEEFKRLFPSRTKKGTANVAFVRSPSQTSAVLRALQKDWNNVYFPHSLVALQDLIRRYQLLDVSKYYAKTLVFVQSSGMGKSRLADAFGQCCPMINFILRESGTSGFPPPDEEILLFLRDPPPANIPGPISRQERSSDFLERRAAVAWNHALATALLQASFETFSTWVESQPFTMMTLEELAGGRHTEMATLEPTINAQDAKSQRPKIRIEFCDSVVKRARVIAQELISNWDWMGKFDDDRPSKVHHHQLEMAHSVHQPNPLNGLLNAAKNLMKILQQCRGTSKTGPLLVIVFDEASSLMRMRPSDEPNTGLYVALNRIISCLKKFRAWSFFLSTESLIGHLVPPKNIIRTGNYLIDTSARESLTETNTELMRFPPFVSFQLDIEDRRKMQNPILRKEELLKPLKTFAELKHMAQFGRPLWHAYANEGHDMIKLAKLKLIGGQQGGNYNASDRNHVFAALSFRLALDVCLQNPCTIPLTRTAVNSFMRVVISMDHETGVMDTVTPAEPVLARAAMEYLCAANWSRSIETLCEELLEKGLIEKGRKGELYARLVLILAHDWVRWARSIRLHRVPKFAPTFSVSHFLKALYARDHHDTIRKIPEQIHEARMNFTHFVPADEQITPEVIPALCRDLLRRSAAMQLSWNQETYDLLIPVYYGSEDEELDPSNYGVILVQVKNKKEATTPREIFQEDFKNISPETSNLGKSKAISSERKPTKFVFNQMTNPILFLLFDLGVVRSNQAHAPLVQVMRSESGLRPDLWAIHSRGYDYTVFGCLQYMNATDSSERFFASIKMGETLADQLSLRNKLFHMVREGFRYEEFEQEGRASAEWSEASVQEQGVDKVGKERGAVDIEAQEEEASNIRSKRKEVEIPQDTQDTQDNRFPKRPRKFL